MGRPLSDEERRAIDMRRVDDVLAKFASTPLDELDAEKWLSDLDSAMTPGNMRRPLDVTGDAPTQASKRTEHHEIGDAVADDIDYASLGWVEDSEIETVHASAQFDTDEGFNTELRSHGPTADPTWASGDFGTDDATQPSSDNGLNLSSGLQQLLSQRSQGFTPTGQADDVNSQPESSADADESSSRGPGTENLAATTPDGRQSSSDPGNEDTPTSTIPAVQSFPAAMEDAPIPLRTKTHESSRSAGSKLGSIRGLYTDALDDKGRKGLKFLAVGLAALAVLGLVQLVVSTSNSAPDTSANTESHARTAEIRDEEIPVPENAVGVLAPSAISARCPDGSTDARLAFTPDKSQAWICQRALGIDGAILEISFPHPVVVTDVFLVPGFDYVEPSGIDRWAEHRVVTRVQWGIGDQRFIHEINPSRSGASMAVPSVETQKISLTIMQTEESSERTPSRGLSFGAGSTNDDSFAVSIIRVTGHQP
ncbi:hypothetical protein [Rhodococcus pyridinivorans]|uniref:hypothetical protein n=1 Tax=Rhodococcus pyridinivorans TaxID=103816 RepID=UPI002658C7CD|nr:hypothetical protein [Rhodococcus pyridinivorans]